MQVFPQDIFTEPEPDPHTLRNLGPLAPLAGIWEGQRGLDVHPAEEGTEKNAYIERIELQPIDAQTNGPQLYYGLRYHSHIVKPDDVETFHDQVGYWLWEPATGTLLQTLAIPRGQIAMAIGMGNIARRAMAKPGIESTKFRTSRWSTLKCCRRNGNRHWSQSRARKRQVSSGLPM